MRKTGKKVYMAEVTGAYGITLPFVFMSNPSMLQVEQMVRLFCKENSSDGVFSKSLTPELWQEAFEFQYEGYEGDYESPLCNDDGTYLCWEMKSVTVAVWSEEIIDNRASAV